MPIDSRPTVSLEAIKAQVRPQALRDDNKHMGIFAVRVLLQAQYKQQTHSPTLLQALNYLHLSPFERIEYINSARLSARSKYDPFGTTLN